MASVQAAARAGAKAPVRRDPRRRHTDGSSPWTRLDNRRPDRVYCWVNQGASDFGVDYYESLGYEIERQSKDGVRPQGGRTTRKDDEPITYRGNVLMSCDKARRDEIELEGPDGNSGQLDADHIENLMVDRSKGRDLLRGIGIRGADGRPWAGVQNETTALEAVFPGGE